MKGKILNCIIFCSVFSAASVCFMQVLKAQELTPPQPPQNNKDTTEIFVSVEQMPIFPGGQEEIMYYINKNIEHPEKGKGKSGVAYISFVINKQGKVQNAKVARGILGASELDSAALKVISNMPNWKPGKQNGKTVNVSYVLPIKFK